jgi:hypothetical protein
MKAFRILTTVVLLTAMLVISGCGSKSSPVVTPQDKQLGLLSKTWKISSVTLDTGSPGPDQTSKWTGFQLTITGTPGGTTFNYACASRPALGPWPASGTWTFGADPVTQIIRTEDTLPITYTVTATTLTMNFKYSGSGYTRVGSVGGNWVFSFTN